MGKWDMVRLGDVCAITTGGTPKTSESRNYETDDMPFFKPSDFAENTINRLKKAEGYISAYAAERARKIPPQSVLVTCIGIIGKVGITSVESTFNQQINGIIPKTERCHTGYLAYAIMHSNRQLKDMANAAVVPIVNKSQFSDLRVPFPPLPTQQKIAYILDRAGALIEKRKAQIEKLDLLVKSQFIEMFGDPVTNPMGWEVKRLSEHLYVVGGYAFSSDGYLEDGIPVLRIGNINTGIFSDNNLVFWIYDDRLNRYLLYPGDIVISLTGTVGKDDYANVCILGHEYERY